jgi:hypothetical protein
VAEANPWANQGSHIPVIANFEPRQMTGWLTAIPLRPKLAIAHGDKANVRGRCSGRQIICFGAVLPALCPSVRVSRLPIELQQLDLPLTVASHQSQGVLYELCCVKMLVAISISK